MGRRLIVAVTLCWVISGGFAALSAGELTLVIRNGHVNLTARDVSAKQILAEWARVGQTVVLNGDRVTGPSLTLQLNGTPEKDALDIILRSASGYMAVTRSGLNSGLSMFDRILVMPTSVGAPVARDAPPAPRPSQTFGAQPASAGVEPVGNDEGEAADEQQDVTPAEQDAGPGSFPAGNPYERGSFPGMFPGPNRQFPSGNVNIPSVTVEEPEAPPATNPWNIPAGSSRPGVISQPQPPDSTPQNPPDGSS